MEKYWEKKPTDLPVEDLAHLGLDSNQLSLMLNLLLLPHLVKVVDELYFCEIDENTVNRN